VAELTREIREAVDRGLLFAAEGDSYLAPVRVEDSGQAVCAVLIVNGEAERPHEVAVRTVLTMAMAVASFGHLPGLIAALSHARLAAA
jgi:hypothetical protein